MRLRSAQSFLPGFADELPDTERKARRAADAIDDGYGRVGWDPWADHDDDD
jgi:hypothetical protein